MKEKWWTEFNLSVRAYNVLKAEELSFDEALQKPDWFWMRCPNCGRQTTKEIMTMLTYLQYGYDDGDIAWW